MAYADVSLEAPEAGLTKDSAGEELYRIGLMYSTGMGVAVDYVAAHKWFNLAAVKGVREAREQRREMVDYMSSIELRQAQRAAREWMQKAH
ncbi:SEL1-like repeat protein [Hirschia maritima]|uniref:SEL1-like repeat protein n=1 Tax=Hirschia maritima TaxID=1121961 RepID=UPI0003668EEC|nr:SEL1-like repeat protein [Hirschia maritima]